MRKSEKRILINNALMLALAVGGLVLIVVGYGAVEKVTQ